MAGTDTSEAVDVVDSEEGQTELERTIGLTGGLTIGVGTMIGAGIFVFPGLAAGNAGPAASLSFAIGAVIALLVALPTSELATAMPKSGGGYYFISRGIGPRVGAIVGISLWFGLVFATAFYLVGFGEYLLAVFREVGVPIGGTIVGPIRVVSVIGVLCGVALTSLALFGTENTTKLQNAVVSLLLVILSAFLLFGLLSAVGVVGDRSAPEQFFPFGTAPVVSTAALVFTSYLGFAQVATVAGEIRDPGRNLPLAMVSSVILVGVFYVLTIVVSTGAFGSERLSTFGETAIVEVARSLLGPGGAVAILVAGLLATASSANASILSGSRALYAISRDRVVPKRAARVNLKYGTPHVALALVGGPTLLLVAVGRTEVLAEVASFLHLVMYGLICVTLLVVRRRSPDWYDPEFRLPAGSVVAAAGALSSFGLIGFMQPASQIIGLIVLLAAGAWYYLYDPDRTFGGD